MSDDDPKAHPTNRAGVPKDVADVVEYLIGARFVNGQDVVVDGGSSKTKIKVERSGWIKRIVWLMCTRDSLDISDPGSQKSHGIFKLSTNCHFREKVASLTGAKEWR